MQKNSVFSFIQDSFKEWPQVQKIHQIVKDAITRQVIVKGHSFMLYHLPHRVQSTTTGYHKPSMKGTPLEDHNLDSRQRSYPITENYSYLINPFPIFENHGIIRSNKVQPQSFFSHAEELTECRLAVEDEYALLYNGTHCGASIPEHWHVHVLPSSLFKQWGLNEIQYLSLDDGLRKGIRVSLHRSNANQISFPTHHPDSLINALILKKDDIITWVLFYRKQHKHRFFPASVNGEGYMISPGVVDVLGHISCVRENDMKTLTPQAIEQIFEDIF